MKQLKDERKGFENLNPVWRSIGDYMRKSIIKRFDKAEAPDGTPWEPIKAPSETRLRREMRGRNVKRKGQMKPLNDTGALRRSIHYFPSVNSVIIGTRLKYAPVHQFGADIKVTPKMRAYLHSQGIHLRKSTNEIHIPARPFIGASLEDIQVVRDIVRKYVMRNL